MMLTLEDAAQLMPDGIPVPLDLYADVAHYIAHSSPPPGMPVNQVMRLVERFNQALADAEKRAIEQEQNSSSIGPKGFAGAGNNQNR